MNFSEDQKLQNLVVSLYSNNQEVLRRAKEDLVQLGLPAVDPLIKAFKEIKLWLIAVEILAEIGEPALPSLIIALEDSTLDSFAFDAITRIGSPAVPLLIKSLSQKGDKRSWVVMALGTIGDKRAKEALFKVLEEDTDALVKLEAVRGLGKIGDEQVLAALEKISADKFNFVLREEINKGNRSGGN